MKLTAEYLRNLIGSSNITEDSIESLNLGYMDITEEESINELVQFFIKSQIKSVKSLNLFRNNLNDETLRPLINALVNHKFTIGTLYLGQNSIIDSSIKDLKKLGVIVDLQDLDLILTAVTSNRESSEAKILQALQQNNISEILDLEGSDISDLGATNIALALASNNTLRYLKLSDNLIRGSGASAIANTLIKNKNNKLTVLTLDNNQIDNKGAEKIAEMLKVNNVLLKLFISNNNIDDNGVEKIIEALKINRSLTYLAINASNISDIGAEKIAEMLKVNRTLVTLEICNNKIGSNGFAKILEALNVNKTLIKLYISENQIGDDGIKNIVDVFKTNKSLAYLSLNSCNITDSGAEKIAEMLKVNRTLIGLEICNNKIGQLGTRKIKESDKITNTIIRFQLNENLVMEESIQNKNRTPEQPEKSDQNSIGWSLPTINSIQFNTGAYAINYLRNGNLLQANFTINLSPPDFIESVRYLLEQNKLLHHYIETTLSHNEEIIANHIYKQCNQYLKDVQEGLTQCIMILSQQTSETKTIELSQEHEIYLNILKSLIEDSKYYQKIADCLYDSIVLEQIPLNTKYSTPEKYYKELYYLILDCYKYIIINYKIMHWEEIIKNDVPKFEKTRTALLFLKRASLLFENEVLDEPTNLLSSSLVNHTPPLPTSTNLQLKIEHRKTAELFAAIKNNNEVKAEDIINKNRELLNTTYSEYDRTPLLYAVYCGEKNLVKWLLANFPNLIFQRDNRGFSIFHTVCMHSHIKMLDYLAKNYKLYFFNSKVSTDSYSHWGTLQVAVYGNNIEVIKYLLDTFSWEDTTLLDAQKVAKIYIENCHRQKERREQNRAVTFEQIIELLNQKLDDNQTYRNFLNIVTNIEENIKGLLLKTLDSTSGSADKIIGFDPKVPQLCQNANCTYYNDHNEVIEIIPEESTLNKKGNIEKSLKIILWDRCKGHFDNKIIFTHYGEPSANINPPICSDKNCTKHNNQYALEDIINNISYWKCCSHRRCDYRPLPTLIYSKKAGDFSGFINRFISVYSASMSISAQQKINFGFNKKEKEKPTENNKTADITPLLLEVNCSKTMSTLRKRKKTSIEQQLQEMQPEINYNNKI